MSEQAIIEFLKVNGPSTPAKLAKHLGISLLFASAMLGEVASKGLAKMSNLKIGGGSPLYYLKDQEELLQEFSGNLNVKEREAYELIKSRKILKDNEQAPLMRVTLRSIKDFAVPVYIIIKGNKEMFWKWFMLNDSDVEEEMKKLLGIKTEDGKEEMKPEVKPVPVKPVEVKSSETVQETVIVEKKPVVKEKPKEIQAKIIEDVNEGGFSGAEFDLNADFSVKNTRAFAKKITKYFEEKEIIILNYEQIKKNKEFNFILKVPSTVGTSKFYCKAVDKKKINEGDLALAMVEAQDKKLPGLFITTGETAKKMEGKMDTLFKDINFIKI